MSKELEYETVEEHPTFIEAMEKFKEQYQCELEQTGWENSYDDNDGLGDKEYWVNGLVSSPVRGFTIRIGGWFSHDTRDDEDRIYCLLAIQINGETIGECEGIQSWYDVNTKRWDDLEWDSY